jgi:dipeptidyl aminopeptidase/acylaminoacyl peptidase
MIKFNILKGLLIIFVISVIINCDRKGNIVSYDPPEKAKYTGMEIKIQLKCGDILAGTMTIPKDSLTKFPAVILITGSSAHDRDNSKPENPVTAYRPFRQLADILSSNGICVLRMDDRGIGASTGGDINEMTTLERANDIKECLKYLKARPEIDPLRIGLIGLSEGASIAQMIASKDTSIKVIVLLSGIGSHGKEVIDFQVNNGIIDKEKLPNLLRKDQNLKYLYDFDPLQTARLVKQPTLILNGELDNYVPANDANKLGDAMVQNGNNKVVVRILPKYNHLLIKLDSSGVKTDYGMISSNKIPDEVLKIILDWTLKEI